MKNEVTYFRKPMYILFRGQNCYRSSLYAQSWFTTNYILSRVFDFAIDKYRSKLSENRSSYELGKVFGFGGIVCSNSSQVLKGRQGGTDPPKWKEDVGTRLGINQPWKDLLRLLKIISYVSLLYRRKRTTSGTNPGFGPLLFVQWRYSTYHRSFTSE